MSDKWGLGNLTQRDLNSPSLYQYLNRTEPRNPTDWPETKVRQESVQGDKDFFLKKKMTSFQTDIVGLANALAYGSSSLPPGITTIEEGLSFLKETLKILGVSYSC